MKNTTKNKTFLLVVSDFYKDIASGLQKGSERSLKSQGFLYDTAYVAGALEIPQLIAIAEKNKDKYAGYIALGCVIKGETDHYQYVCKSVTDGLTLLGTKGIIIGNGVLTVLNKQQALDRIAEGKNKGEDAALAAIKLHKWKNNLS